MSEEHRQDVVLVTGGASGIGLAVTKSLLSEGWRVLVADVLPDRVERARTELPPDRTRFVCLDVSDEVAVEAAIDSCERDFGGLGGLVNSAGIGRDMPFLETDTALLRKILEVNLVGSFVVAREAAKRMRDHGRGSIVNISSVSGIRGNLGRAAYGASKGGIITLTRVMAVELAIHGIRVNAVAPGPVETPLVKQMHTAAARDEWMNRVPQKRYAAPEEVSGPIAWLLDDKKSGNMTGQIVCVDGGFTAAGLMHDTA